MKKLRSSLVFCVESVQMIASLFIPKPAQQITQLKAFLFVLKLLSCDVQPLMYDRFKVKRLEKNLFLSEVKNII